MKRFCFTVDDNIRFLKELTQGTERSLFAHPYMAMYRRLHERFGLKVQLNLFYEMSGFDLTMVTDRFREEFAANAHWLKLSFHSRLENERPYEFSDYGELYRDCQAVHEQILRFASPAALGRTTTVHYCRTTPEGLSALKDLGVEGLLGLFGTGEAPRSSYSLPEACASAARSGQVVCADGVQVASIDMVINDTAREKLVPELEKLSGREQIRVMIHEQYFYPDYPRYQPDFEEKLETVFRFLEGHGYESCFFEEMI